MLGVFTLKPEGPIYYEEIKYMLEQKRDFKTTFWHWESGLFGLYLYGDGFLAGKIILDSSSNVKAIVVVNR